MTLSLVHFFVARLKTTVSTKNISFIVNRLVFALWTTQKIEKIKKHKKNKEKMNKWIKKKTKKQKNKDENYYMC